MTGTAHEGLAVLCLAFVAAVGLVRYAVTPPRPRARRGEKYVPAAELIPAFAGGWPTIAFRDCVLCRATVPVTVHHGAHRCDLGHTTIHTTTGSAL